MYASVAFQGKPDCILNKTFPGKYNLFLAMAFYLRLFQ